MTLDESSLSKRAGYLGWRVDPASLSIGNEQCRISRPSSLNRISNVFKRKTDNRRGILRQIYISKGFSGGCATYRSTKYLTTWATPATSADSDIYQDL
ncbi:hypothetical protein BCON_0023g00120 [Botryotinia convoluta]|uniref:Uncharacterized protein n=1 Tax=Botryotinia convoluta TaxID=54673 RepID=A0A4Z1IN04_9HELO|nr:hypothetical protein BCON_0023g00120 [Botryotinia convoluta]